MSKEKREEVTFRRSLPDDYQKILEIGNIYFGTDYLPGSYHEYLNSPYRFCYVGEVDEKVVTFCLLYVVDNGEAVVLQASRTHPDYRKLGLFKNIKLHGAREVKTKFPKITRVYGTSVDSRVLQKAIAQKTLVMTNYGVALKITPDLFTSKLTDAFLNDKVYDMKSASISKLSLKDALQVLNNKENQARFFPTGYFVSAWEPFKVMESNFDILLRECHVYADISRGPVCTGVSFGMLRNAPDGIRYDLDINGADDTTTLLAHMLKHILYLKSCEMQRNIYMFVYFGKPAKNQELVLSYCLSVLGLEAFQPYRSFTQAVKNTDFESMMQQLENEAADSPKSRL